MIQRKNVVIKGSMVMRNSNKRAFSKSMQQSQQGSTPFSSEATAATPQSNTASDGSSLGFGVRIVRSPALSTVQTEMEDNLKDRIRELEERVLKLEKENAELKGVEQDGSVVPEPPKVEELPEKKVEFTAWEHMGVHRKVGTLRRQSPMSDKEEEKTDTSFAYTYFIHVSWFPWWQANEGHSGKNEAQHALTKYFL